MKERIYQSLINDAEISVGKQRCSPSCFRVLAVPRTALCVRVCLSCSTGHTQSILSHLPRFGLCTLGIQGFAWGVHEWYLSKKPSYLWFKSALTGLCTHLGRCLQSTAQADCTSPALWPLQQEENQKLQDEAHSPYRRSCVCLCSFFSSSLVFKLWWVLFVLLFF